MSRIAGAYPAIDVFEGRTDAAALLAGAWPQVTPFVEHLMGATFAWAGDARPKIARDPGVIAVVDGSFYNRFEFQQPGMEHASEIVDYLGINRVPFTELPVTIIYSDYSLSKGQSWTNSLKLAIRLIGDKL